MDTESGQENVVEVIGTTGLAKIAIPMAFVLIVRPAYCFTVWVYRRSYYLKVPPKR